jgi:ubiquitin-protein ligase
MTSPRNRRLENEYAAMRELAQSSSLISFTSQGSPPTQYQITFVCHGLARLHGELTRLSRHEFTFTLDGTFPLAPPVIVWKTPIFHPNMKPPDVCTGDIWYPAFTLAGLCVSLCELVQYKSFNVYDPLDNEAANWLIRYLQADESGIPVDRRPILDPDFELNIRQQANPE